MVRVRMTLAAALAVSGCGVGFEEGSLSPSPAGSGGNVGGSSASGGAGGGDVATGGVGGAGASGGAGGTVNPTVYAPSFDGEDDYLVVARPPFAELTIEAWIKTTDSLPGSQFYQGAPLVFADLPGTVDDFAMTIINGHLCFGGSNQGTGDITLESTIVVNTGDWIHVAAVHRADGTLQLMIGGNLEGELSTPLTNPLTSTPEIYFGGTPGFGTYLNGRLREIRIWSAALSSSEIQTGMFVQLAGTETNLVGYWRLDEGSGAMGGDMVPGGSSAVFGGGDPQLAPTWVEDGPPLLP